MSKRSRGGPSGSLDARAARVAAAELVSRRAWARAELDARLRRRGASPEVSADVVAELVLRGYVDDAAFARQWVEIRSARGYGPDRLAAELRSRGVAQDVIAVALGALDQAQALDRARAVARRRFGALAADPGAAVAGSPAGAVRARAATRLRDYLLRRGHEPAVVARVVREVTAAAPSVTESGWT
jgi:regulatory protein